MCGNGSGACAAPGQAGPGDIHRLGPDASSESGLNVSQPESPRRPFRGSFVGKRARRDWRQDSAGRERRGRQGGVVWLAGGTGGRTVCASAAAGPGDAANGAAASAARTAGRLRASSCGGGTGRVAESEPERGRIGEGRDGAPLVDQGRASGGLGGGRGCGVCASAGQRAAGQAALDAAPCRVALLEPEKSARPPSSAAGGTRTRRRRRRPRAQSTTVPAVATGQPMWHTPPLSWSWMTG